MTKGKVYSSYLEEVLSEVHGVANYLGNESSNEDPAEFLKALKRIAALTKDYASGIVGIIVWREEDVRQVLKECGYAATKENVEKVLNSSIGKGLQNRSIELGWEIMRDLLPFDLKVRGRK